MRKDIPFLKEWLKQYKELTNMELAQMAGVSVKTIQRWKHKCGIKLTNRGWGCKTDRPEAFKNAYMLKRNEIKKVPKSVWNNKEWLEENYKHYGLKTLSRITGHNKGGLYERMKRLGIKIRTVSEANHSTNKCCTKEWLEENYEIMGLTLTECAKKANVNIYTIMNWLVKFGMPIRDTYECQYGELSKNYGKKKVSKINDTGLGNSINASFNNTAHNKPFNDSGRDKISREA